MKFSPFWDWTTVLPGALSLAGLGSLSKTDSAGDSGDFIVTAPVK